MSLQTITNVIANDHECHRKRSPKMTSFVSAQFLTRPFFSTFHRPEKVNRRSCPVIASSTSSPHSTSSLDSLVKWCNQVGIQFHGVTVQETQSTRGLFAIRDLSPGDQLIAIPRHAALLTNVQSEEVPSFRLLTHLSPEYWKNVPWYIQLAIRLLDQNLDPDSSFSEYLQVLPPNPNSALFAYEVHGRQAVADQLRPYHLQNLADVFRAQAKSYFTGFRNALPQRSRDLVTLRSFCWAVSIAVSRGFGIPQSGYAESHLQPYQLDPALPPPAEYALFPALDMANCSVHCKTKFVYDRGGDIFRVFTGASFAKGEQVYVSYGSKSNDDFMFFYGFVEGSNPANTVKVPDFRSWVLSLSHEGNVDPKDWDRKLTLLLKEKSTHPDKAYSFQADRIDEDLLFVLRVSLASPEELDIIEEELRKETPKKSKTLSLQNELAVWRAIEVKCESLLEELDEFDEDEQARLTNMFKKWPYTAAWTWGESESDGELLYRYERQETLSATIERVRHFSSVSMSVGRICTVLVPASQTRLRADLFENMTHDTDTSGVYRYEIAPEDLQNYFDS